MLHARILHSEPADIMEDSPANQLPEVDSLPDGFVESSPDPLHCGTSFLDIEKPSSDYMNTLAEVDQSTEPSNDPSRDDNEAAKTSALTEPRHHESERVEKTEKARTFPVPLSERDGSDPCVNPLEIADKRTEMSVKIPFCNELSVDSSPSHEHLEGSSLTSEQPIEEHLELHANLQETVIPKSRGHLKNSKLESCTEGKNKLVKRRLKSEKELLEFTWKYQKAITERDAAIAVREKLESLCRELQRQNKILMDECKRVSTEGQNMRVDLSTKFHDAIKDVSNKLEEQKEECLSQLRENEMLKNKLKHLTEQYAISEQQFAQEMKKMTLELQLADLKIQQHHQKSDQEQTQMRLYAEQISQLLATEKNLHLQLAADGEKFQQFQDALVKSNEVFETFKQEMEKMAKSLKELKKENIFLKSKCEKSDVSLIELVEEREMLKKQLEKMKNQKEKLESLCRSLQAERKQHLFGTSDSAPVSSQLKSGPEEES